MADITIPPAALEAGARAICAGNKWDKPCDTPCSDCLPEARAAFLAMINEWPGKDIVGYGPPFYGIDLILPLTEKTDDQA